MVKEVAKHKNMIIDKMHDIKSLKQQRDTELLGFTTSVAEFNRQLEDERLKFNEKLRELDAEKRKQVELLKGRILELQDQQALEKEQLAKDIETDEEKRDLFESRFTEKDQAMNQLIEEYMNEIKKLKLENADLRTEYESAKQSIRDYMSQVDPEDEIGDTVPLPQMLKSLNQRLNVTRGYNNLLSPEARPSGHGASHLVRCYTHYEDNQSENMMSPTTPGHLPKRKSKRPAFEGFSLDIAPGERGVDLTNLRNRPRNRTLESINVTTSIDSEADEPSDVSAGLRKTGDSKVMGVFFKNRNSSHEILDTDNLLESLHFQTEVIPPEETPLFKLGRQIGAVVPQKRNRPKVAELANAAEAKSRIKQTCKYTPVAISRSRSPMTKVAASSSTCPGPANACTEGLGYTPAS